MDKDTVYIDEQMHARQKTGCIHSPLLIEHGWATGTVPQLCSSVDEITCNYPHTPT